MVTVHAPRKLPTSAAPAAGSSDRQRSTTRRAYSTVAQAVPQIAAPLLVPNSVAGAAAGYTLNSAGTSTSPPPPTMASMNPASSDASATVDSSSIGVRA